MQVDEDLLVQSPSQASTGSIQYIQALHKEAGGGIKTGIVDLDKVLLPMRPGELITVMGYTSNYKSGFMNWCAKEALKSIPPGNDDEVVVKVTWEQSVEEDTISWLAFDSGISITQMARGALDTKDWSLINRSAIRRAVTPIWIVGHSQLESEKIRKPRPRMTMTDVMNACEFICNDATDHKLKIRLVVLDYLQRIRPDPSDGGDKRLQVMEAVNRVKDLGISFGTPVMLGVQTKRILDRENKSPRIDDGQETSNIEQSSDKVIGVWYPIKTEKEGSKIGDLVVQKNLLIASILKQKLGPAPATFALYVDPEHNHIGSMDTSTDVY